MQSLYAYWALVGGATDLERHLPSSFRKVVEGRLFRHRLRRRDRRYSPAHEIESQNMGKGMRFFSG